MGVIKFTQEIKVRVAAKRMFKAMVTESYTVLPKILSSTVKSIDIIQGDGGVGTIRQTNFPDGAPYPYMKHQIDEIDTDKNVSKYTLIEGPMLGDKIEKIHYTQTFEDSSDGGCVVKIVSEYHTKGDVELKEEEIKAGKDQFLGYFKLAEESLLAHPDVCA